MENNTTAALTNEQRNTLESLARTSTPYECEVIRSILDTSPQAEVPEGWKLVPIEPDLKMVLAGENYIGRHAWKKMLDAAPAATSGAFIDIVFDGPPAKPVAKITGADEYGPMLQWSTHWVELIGANLYTTQPTARAPFQQRVQPWMHACFGAEISADRVERNHRFLEEALELVQACGCTASEAHQLVDYTFGRPLGEPAQEVGGVMVTLAGLCLANDLDMHAAGETELARVWTKVDQIRAKHAAKPKHSPLPDPTAPEHCQCPACRAGTTHASDCAVHNAPALPRGACDCGAGLPDSEGGEM